MGGDSAMTGDQQRYSFDHSGRWSGGAHGFLRIVDHAEQRQPILRGGADAIPIIPRNVPLSKSRRSGPFVLAPQNAWPWTPSFAGGSELRRVVGLRLASEYYLRRAVGVLRVSGAIPEINPNTSPVIHHVLDSGFESALVESSQCRVDDAEGKIVSIGSLHSYRNLANLVLGFRRYREQGGRRELWLAGPPGSAAAARALDQAVNATQGVKVRREALSRTECLSALRSAAAVVLPSRVEASPVSALEAVSCTPNVVLSRIVGHQEILAEYGPVGQHALFDPKSPQSIARTLANAETEPFAAGHSSLASEDVREDARISWGRRVAEWLASLTLRSREVGGQRTE